MVIRIMIVADPALFRRALAQALAREHDVDVVGDYDRAGGLDGTAADVRNYLSAVIRKTGARNRLEAILAADRAGWL